AGIVDTLPQYPLVEPARRDIVEVVKEKILAKPEDDLLASTMSTESLPALLKTLEQTIHSINNVLVVGTQGRRWASEFARMYVQTRRIRDKIGELDTILSVTQEAYTVLMVEQMEAEGTSAI